MASPELPSEYPNKKIKKRDMKSRNKMILQSNEHDSPIPNSNQNELTNTHAFIVTHFGGIHVLNDPQISEEEQLLIGKTFNTLTRISYRACITKYLEEYGLSFDLRTITRFLNQQSSRLGHTQFSDYKTALKKFLIPIVNSSSKHDSIDSRILMRSQIKSTIKGISYVEWKEPSDEANDREVLNYMYTNLIYYGLLSEKNGVNQIMHAF